MMRHFPTVVSPAPSTSCWGSRLRTRRGSFAKVRAVGDALGGAAWPYGCGDTHFWVAVCVCVCVCVCWLCFWLLYLVASTGWQVTAPEVPLAEGVKAEVTMSSIPRKKPVSQALLNKVLKNVERYRIKASGDAAYVTACIYCRMVHDVWAAMLAVSWLG